MDERVQAKMLVGCIRGSAYWILLKASNNIIEGRDVKVLENFEPCIRERSNGIAFHHSEGRILFDDIVASYDGENKKRWNTTRTLKIMGIVIKMTYIRKRRSMIWNHCLIILICVIQQESQLVANQKDTDS